MSYSRLHDAPDAAPVPAVPTDMAGLCQALQAGNTAGFSQAILASADLRADLTAGASQHGPFDIRGGMPLNPIHAAVSWARRPYCGSC